MSVCERAVKAFAWLHNIIVIELVHTTIKIEDSSKVYKFCDVIVNFEYSMWSKLLSWDSIVNMQYTCIYVLFSCNCSFNLKYIARVLHTHWTFKIWDKVEWINCNLIKDLWTISRDFGAYHLRVMSFFMQLMHKYLEGLEAYFFAWDWIYGSPYFVCASREGSSEPSLLTYGISTKISWAGSCLDPDEIAHIRHDAGETVFWSWFIVERVQVYSIAYTFVAVGALNQTFNVYLLFKPFFLVPAEPINIPIITMGLQSEGSQVIWICTVFKGGYWVQQDTFIFFYILHDIIQPCLAIFTMALELIHVCALLFCIIIT